MFTRTLTTAIVLLLLLTTSGSQSAIAQTTTEAQRTEETRTKISKLAAGKNARFEIRLRDNTKLKGFLGATSEDSFTLTDPKTGATRTVAYADVAQVKKQGGGLSTRTLVILGAAATAAVIVGVTVIKPVLCDGGAGC